MAKQIQLRRGTTAENNGFTGAVGEVTVDTEKDVLVVHDGGTVGGFPNAARANPDGTISVLAKDGTQLSYLHSGTKLAEYVPLPYPSSTPPSGYLMLLGQAISQASYPILYSMYGANLPDLRGVFIRGWDNGRGLDIGRDILTYQDDAIRNITGSTESVLFGGDVSTGSLSTTQKYSGTFSGNTYGSTRKIAFDASKVVPTAEDNRPRNVAFNYIVKAG